MSTHQKKLSMDSYDDRSDILSILESIESMFEVCRCVHNSYTQAGLMLSITSEAEMLLLKLRVMQERWRTHLPFKEASNINFYNWGKKIEQIAKAVAGVEQTTDSDYSLDKYCPSKHYLLDLYECLDESPSRTGGTPYYAETSVTKFISEENRIRSKISKKWNEYSDRFSALVPRELNEHLGSVFASIADREPNIRLTCNAVLQKLSTALYALYDTPNGRISPDLFARLADRVVGEEEYGGRKAKSTVEHEVNEIKNDTPDDEWEARREEEIKVAVDLVKDMTLGSKVFSFLGRDKTMLDNPAGLGRFLWSVRNNISKGDLYNLIELLYRIAYLSRDREQQATVAVETVSETSAEQDAQSEPKDAESIRRKRKATKLQTPLLPKFYSTKLSANEAAVEKYYETLHHCGYYIGRTLTANEKRDPDACTYAGWKWTHLRDAFVRLGFFRSDSSKRGFAQHLADVFPYLTMTNIQRGFNSRGTYVDSNATATIIGEMEFEFEEVAVLAGLK